jgi:hypothetical protein
MADFLIRRLSKHGVKLPSGSNHNISIRKKLKGNQVEIADIHFNLGSPMITLDEKGSLIHGACHAYFYAKDNPGLSVVIVGHADTSGKPKDNFILSEKRARCVKSLLMGDEVEWRKVASEAKTNDYQRSIKSLADLYYWDCALESVDNQYGPKTKRAVKGFQREANCLLGSGLKLDGVMGPKSWTALLHVLRFLFKQSGADITQTWNFLKDNQGIYACGESFPIDQIGKDNYKSQNNRRVEIFLGRPEEMTPLNPPKDPNKNLLPEDCIFYSPTECDVVPMSKKSSISILHSSPDGEPIPDAKMRLIDENGNPVSEWKQTGSDGWVYWYGLEAGNYKVEMIPDMK